LPGKRGFWGIKQKGLRLPLYRRRSLRRSRPQCRLRCVPLSLKKISTQQIFLLVGMIRPRRAAVNTGSGFSLPHTKRTDHRLYKLFDFNNEQNSSFFTKT